MAAAAPGVDEDRSATATVILRMIKTRKDQSDNPFSGRQDRTRLCRGGSRRSRCKGKVSFDEDFDVLRRRPFSRALVGILALRRVKRRRRLSIRILTADYR